MKCKNFAMTKKIAFEGGDQINVLEVKKFAKTKKWNSKKKCSAGATGRCFEANDRLLSH